MGALVKKNREYRRENPVWFSAICKKYRKRYPEKIKARWRAYYSFKITNEKCQLCNAPATERHHISYLDPLILVLVCKPCHAKIHL